MPVVRFPDPSTASPEGLVAVGGDLHPDTVLCAYRQGIFPWPVDDLPLLWFSPAQRGVLEFGNLHVSRSLGRARRRSDATFTVDAAFREVIRHCASVPRAGQRGTWITPEMIDAYGLLHDLGIAHSVEVWRGGRLIGGIYGLDVDGAFAAESMFRLETGASKLALLHLVDHLRARGLDWIDVQVLSPNLARLGAVEMPREAFLERLRDTRARGLRLFPSAGDGAERRAR